VSSIAQRARSRYASLRRSRPADDPELLEARRRMREEALVGAIDRALKNGPQITPALHARIVGMLTAVDGSTA
jgi:hypothetical protein